MERSVIIPNQNPLHGHPVSTLHAKLSRQEQRKNRRLRDVQETFRATSIQSSNVQTSASLQKST